MNTDKKTFLERMTSLENRVAKLESQSETGLGYKCKLCGIQRPTNWFIYEIEKAGEWVTPCCAMCARENKSRGPYPQGN